MRVVIESIPHAEQRYDTVGDWWWAADGTLEIRVSESPGEMHLLIPWLVGIHELVEAFLCKQAGISEEDVTQFDLAQLASSAQGESGDDPAAPYRRQHAIATIVERIVVWSLNLSWRVYDEAVDAIGKDGGVHA